MATLKVRPKGAVPFQGCYPKWHRQHPQGRRGSFCHFGQLGVSLQAKKAYNCEQLPEGEVGLHQPRRSTVRQVTAEQLILEEPQQNNSREGDWCSLRDEWNTQRPILTRRSSKLHYCCLICRQKNCRLMWHMVIVRNSGKHRSQWDPQGEDQTGPWPPC